MNCRNYFEEMHHCEHETNNLRSVVHRIIKQLAAHSNCIVFITDPFYRRLIDVQNMETSSILSKYDVSNIVSLSKSKLAIFTNFISV